MNVATCDLVERWILAASKNWPGRTCFNFDTRAHDLADVAEALNGRVKWSGSQFRGNWSVTIFPPSYTGPTGWQGAGA